MLFLGAFGVHRFYLGQTGKGIFYFFTLGLMGLLPILDFLIWLLGSNESFDGKFNVQAIQKEQMNIQKEILNGFKKK